MSTVLLRNILLQTCSRRTGLVVPVSIKFVSTSSDANVIKSRIPDIAIPNITLPEHLFQNLDKWPNKIALECGITGRNYTYEALRVKSRNLNRGLRKKLKLTKGAVVAILLPNVPEYPISMLGIVEAGLVATTINPIYTADEIWRQLNDSSATAIITLTQLAGLAGAAVKRLPKQIPIITIKTQATESTPGGTINFGELIDVEHDIEDAPPCSPSDYAIMPYSSGTTGLPKGVQLTHANIVANLSQINHKAFKLAKDTTADHQDVVPSVLPMFHIYGMTSVLLNNLYLGCKVVALAKFTPELFITTLVKYKPQILYIVPPIVIFLAMHPSVKKEFLAPVRAVISGAAPLGKLDEEKLLRKADKPIDMFQGYGLTETSPVVTFTANDRKREHGSVGEAIPNTMLKVAPLDNPTGPALGPHENGELFVKGPQVMKGYHSAPDQTDTFCDGWFRTGDLVHYDENQMIYVTERLKELIKVKGFQVAPAELEEIIRDHPSISDAAVIGINHRKLGEVPRAYVVAKPGTKVDTEELKEYVSKKVADFKQLKGGIVVVESIPKNNAGKILRKELKQQYEAEDK